jgi:hypothetical protein
MPGTVYKECRPVKWREKWLYEMSDVTFFELTEGEKEPWRFASSCEIAILCRRTKEASRVVSPITLEVKRYQNNSEKVENFTIVAQGDSQIWQGFTTTNVLSMQ